MGQAGTLSALIEQTLASRNELRAHLPAIVEETVAIATRAGRAKKLSTHDAEDVAQNTAHRFVVLLESGERPEAPDAFVWRMATNAAVDIHRARKRRSEGRERLMQSVDVLHASTQDAEADWLALERQTAAQRHVRAALARAPENYRVALEHHLDGMPVEILADSYYAAMVADGDVDTEVPAGVQRAKKRARNRADQHLKRGKAWLQAELQALIQEDAL